GTRGQAPGKRSPCAARRPPDVGHPPAWMGHPSRHGRRPTLGWLPAGCQRNRVGSSSIVGILPSKGATGGGRPGVLPTAPGVLREPGQDAGRVETVPVAADVLDHRVVAEPDAALLLVA